MLEKVKQYAMVKYAGDEALVKEFVEGFIKQADFSNQRRYGLDGSLESITETISGKGLSGVFQEGVTGAIGKGLGGLAVGLGIHGLNQAFAGAERSSMHTHFLSALARAIESNRILREAERSRVEQYADTVFKFAPHVASDPNLLSSILANAIHGEGIDPMTVKTLSDLESRFIENRGAGSFSPKTYV